MEGAEGIVHGLAYFHDQKGHPKRKFLVRLITTQTCGFDEGVDAWRKFLSSLPQSDLHLLNWAGATFTVDEWQSILKKVNAEL